MRSAGDDGGEQGQDRRSDSLRQPPYLDLYWQRTNGSGVKGALQVAHAFLGLRLQCAQCHRHPHDVWQQDDLLSFANFFMRVSNPASGTGSSPSVAKEADRPAQGSQGTERPRRRNSATRPKTSRWPKTEGAKLRAEVKTLNEKAQALEAAGQRLKATEIHTGGKATFASVTSTLGKQQSKQFRMLGETKQQSIPRRQGSSRGGDGLAAAAGQSVLRPRHRQPRVGALLRPGHHRPARSAVAAQSRVASRSARRTAAPISSSHGYDLKHLHRTILSSRTYQQSAQTNATNRGDTTNYASFYLRRLPAEVLVDALNHATGGSETYPPDLYLPAGTRALEVAGSTGQRAGAGQLAICLPTSSAGPCAARTCSATASATPSRPSCRPCTSPIIRRCGRRSPRRRDESPRSSRILPTTTNGSTNCFSGR